MANTLPMPVLPTPEAPFDPARTNPMAMEAPGRELTGQMDRASFLFARAGAQQVEHDAVAETGKVMALKRSQWTQTMAQLQQAAPEGAPGFTANFTKAFNADAATTIAGASPAAQNYVAAQMGNLGAAMLDHAAAFEQRARLEKRSSDLGDMVKFNANTARSDPSQFGSLMYETERAVTNSGLPAEAQREALTSGHAALATALVEGAMQRDPAEAKSLLDGGELDRFLAPASKNAFLDQASSAILRNQKQGQAQQQASVGRDYANELQAINATGQGLGALTPAAVRAAYPPQVAEPLLKNLDTARNFYAVKQHVALTGPDEDKALLEAWEPQQGIPSAIQLAAARRGADPDVLNRTFQLESAGGKNTATSSAGAQGPLQLTPRTAAALGVADPNDLDQAADGAARLQVQNKAILERAGINADGAALYLAHQQGGAGAAALLANPDANAVAAVRKFYPNDAVARAAIVGNGGTADMTAGDFTALWNRKYAAGAPGDYGDDVKRHQLLANAIAGKEQALASDPAGYVQANAPALKQAYADAQADPAKLTAALDLQDKLETQLGVPPSQQHVLGADQAKGQVAQLLAAPAAQAGAGIGALEQQYGARWPAAFGDLVKAGLPKSYQLLANIDDPRARGELLNAQRAGAQPLKDLIGPAQAWAIDQHVNDALAPFIRSLAAMPNGAALGDEWKKATQLLAYRYTNMGAAPADALTRAANDLVNAKYDFAQGSGYNARAPKGQLDAVENYAAGRLAALTPDQLWVPPAGPTEPPLTDAQRGAAYMRDGVAGGTWITAPDDRGWMLTDSTGRPVLDRDQRPIGFDFADLQPPQGGGAMAGTAPAAPPPAAPVPMGPMQ